MQRLLRLTIITACSLFLGPTTAVRDKRNIMLQGFGHSRSSSGSAAVEDIHVSQLWPPYDVAHLAEHNGQSIQLVPEEIVLPTGTGLPLPMIAPQEVVAVHIGLAIQDPTRCAAMLYVPGRPEHSRIPNVKGKTQKVVLFLDEEPKNLHMYIPEHCRVFIESFSYFTLAGMEAFLLPSTLRQHASIT